MKKSTRVLTGIIAFIAGGAALAAVALCMVFPNKYGKFIDDAAAEFSLSPALVRSVVWAESKFDKNAVSKKGASGLMQLMPDTFEFCRKALFYAPSEADMFDPEMSLRCGCYYLSLLVDKFDGDTTAALMAYNAGEGNAKKFLAGEPVFEETRKYLDNIDMAMKVYGLMRN